MYKLIKTSDDTCYCELRQADCDGMPYQIIMYAIKRQNRKLGGLELKTLNDIVINEFENDGVDNCVSVSVSADVQIGDSMYTNVSSIIDFTLDDSGNVVSMNARNNDEIFMFYKIYAKRVVIDGNAELGLFAIEHDLHPSKYLRSECVNAISLMLNTEVGQLATECHLGFAGIKLPATALATFDTTKRQDESDRRVYVAYSRDVHNARLPIAHLIENGDCATLMCAAVVKANGHAQLIIDLDKSEVTYSLALEYDDINPNNATFVSAGCYVDCADLEMLERINAEYDFILSNELDFQGLADISVDQRKQLLMNLMQRREHTTLSPDFEAQLDMSIETAISSVSIIH